MNHKPYEWDYTNLAEHYIYRPPYAPKAIDWLFDISRVKEADPCCDIGAGTGALTVELLQRNLKVHAIEPNLAMRRIGEKNTQVFSEVQWMDGTGEKTGQANSQYALVTYGSSFNTTTRSTALLESARILRPNAWFACLWNHRDREDYIQKEVDSLIYRNIPKFTRGSRSEDQTNTILASKAFSEVEFREERILHTIPTAEWLKAWRSHATLVKQAGSKLEKILTEIDVMVKSLTGDLIQVPYTTRIWAARVLKQ
jgi:ubiquinone/menaquinone biosynthesis C-methylase UbiE